AEEGKANEIASAARFHVTPDSRLFVIFYVHGTDASGKRVSENRLMEIFPGGQTGPPTVVPFKKPFTSYFTATVRGGSPASRTLELLGQREGSPMAMAYARVKL